VTDQEKFFKTYATGAGSEARVIEIPSSMPGEYSPFIVVRHQGMTMVLNPMTFINHMAVDVHSFIDGRKATAGVFGMSDGHRWTLEPTPTTSHRWPSANLITVLLGEQGVAK